jgi:hypothetical protein
LGFVAGLISDQGQRIKSPTNVGGRAEFEIVCGPVLPQMGGADEVQKLLLPAA